MATVTITLDDSDDIMIFQTISNSLRQKSDFIAEREEVSLKQMKDLNEEMCALRSELDAHIEQFQNAEAATEDDEEHQSPKKQKEKRIREKFDEITQKMSELDNQNTQMLKKSNLISDLCGQMMCLVDAGNKIIWNATQAATAYRLRIAHGHTSNIDRLFDECQRSLWLTYGYIRNNFLPMIPDEIIAMCLEYYYILLEEQTQSISYNIAEDSLIFETIINSLSESHLMVDTLQDVLFKEQDALNRGMLDLRHGLDKFFQDVEPDIVAFEQEQEMYKAEFGKIQKKLAVLTDRQREINKKFEYLNDIDKKMADLLNISLECIEHSDDWDTEKLARAYTEEKVGWNAELDKSMEFDKVFEECKKSMILVQGYCRMNVDNFNVYLSVLKCYHIIME